MRAAIFEMSVPRVKEMTYRSNMAPDEDRQMIGLHIIRFFFTKGPIKEILIIILFTTATTLLKCDFQIFS